MEGINKKTLQTLLVAAGSYLVLQLLWHKSAWSISPKGPFKLGFNHQWNHSEILPDGIPGTERTLEAMAMFARRDAHDPVVRELATRITRGCRGHDFLCEATKCFEYCRDRIIYRRDPVGQERVQDSRRTLQFICGDCDDKSVLLASLLGALGCESRFRVIGMGDSSFSHVFVEANIPGRGWVAFDPTPERAKPGWRAHGRIEGIFPVWE